MGWERLYHCGVVQWLVLREGVDAGNQEGSVAARNSGVKVVFVPVTMSWGPLI